MRSTSPIAALLLLAVLAACDSSEMPLETPVAEPAPRVPVSTPVVEPAPREPASTPSAYVALDRVAVIGASASAGFGAQIVAGQDSSVRTAAIDLGTALAGAVADDVDADVAVAADAFFYTRPLSRGPELVDSVLAFEPTLVVATDFLFWYAYGSYGPSGEPLRDERERLALFELGLRQLERLGATILVGDLPDMSPAIGLMISSAQVPRPETLVLLNERLDAWAATRQGVFVVPLGAFVESMRDEGVVAIGEQEWRADETRRLLSPDRLHPTGEGLIAIGQLVVNTLIEAGRANPDDFVLDHRVVLERLRERVLRGTTEPSEGTGGGVP